MSDLVVKSKEAHVSKIPETLREDSRKRLGELLNLTEEQRDRLKKWLKEKLEDWKNDTAELHQRLQDDNDLVEGIIMETDFPWEGASNVHVPLTEIYMDGYRSIIKRSILGAGSIWVAEAEFDELMEVTADIETMINYKARSEWNIERALDGVVWTTQRDGLGILQVPWVEEYEERDDIVLLANEDDFNNEFPSPQESGMDEKEWQELKDMVIAEASDEFPIEVPITSDVPVYVGPKAEIVELVHFVTIPAWVSDIKSQACRGYGKEFSYHVETIREKSKDGIFYKDAANRVINKSGSMSVSSYVQSKDEILGIKRTNGKDERELFELTVKGRLDDNGPIKKYLVTYSLECDELLSCMNFPYRVDFYALFRIDDRPNQLIGKNIPAKTRDLNDATDDQYNHRVNARKLSTAPIFQGQADLKEELQLELDQNKIRPGAVLWMKNFDAFRQLIVQPTDTGESMQEEERMMRVLDMYLGMPASLFAGGVPSGDPQAPGNKTAVMINQGNLRMEDPISFFRYGVEELGDICLSHLYQFGAPIINFKAQGDKPGEKPERKTLYKKLLRKGIHMKMNGITVLDNPESEMQKMFLMLDMLNKMVPAFMQNPALSVEVARDALKKGRVGGRERYLPSVEDMEAQMVKIQKKAMQQMAMEKEMAERQAFEEAQKARLAGAKQQLDIKNTAQKMAEANLPLNGNAVPALNGGME